MTCTKIKTKLLYPKLHYFLSTAGLAAFWPYIAVFGRQLGVPEVGIGLIFSVAPAIGMIANPIFGAIADRYKAKKKLFLLFNLVMLVFITGFAFLPQTQITKPVSLECTNFNTNESYVPYVASKSNYAQSLCNSNEQTILTTGQDSNLSSTLTNHESCTLLCILDPHEKETFCETYFTPTNKTQFCTNQELPTSVSISIDLNLNTNPISQEQHAGTTFYRVDSQNIYIVQDDDLPYRADYSCGKNSSRISNCRIDCYESINFNRKFEMLKLIVDAEEFHKSTIFWLYFTLIIACWIAFTVVNSVGDTLTFQTLGDQSHLYGQQRQWGAIGWGAFSLLSGYLIDYHSKDSILKDYTSSFYMLWVLLTFNFIVCYMWPVEEQEKPESLTKNIIGLIMNPKIFVFILACIAVGFCTGLIWNFLFWYVETLASCEQKKWIKVLQGLINFTQCFGGELPFFYLSGWFIRKLGHAHCMTLVLGAFGCRFLIYSVLTNPWTILPVELFQGITFGIFWSTMASYAYVVSPDGSAATVQGLVSAAFKGIGIGGGSLIGGILFKVLSGRMAFRIFGFASLAFCLLHHLVSMYFRTRNFTPVSQISENDLKMEEKDESDIRKDKESIDIDN